MGDAAQTLGTSTFERMKAMILDGTLEPGAPLREKNFADRLGVSRTPVREAISQLVSEGFAERATSGTPVVSSISLADIMEILHVRSLLECEAARKAALSNGKKDDLLELRAKIVGFLDGIRPNSEAHFALDVQLHLAIARNAGSRLLAELIEGLKVKTRMYGQGSIPERFEPGCHEHLAIIDAIVSGEPENAAEAMRFHLKKVRESIISHINHPF
ncbi:GntR family transcriptional regulator [Sulfitobacter guttiformis]|uniref:DNA-binding GntR family transcriptional regulator n=1 Tax=Sulfitobacter guttiformis TaxID=74349 RepID=A0A420DNZ4_9RHOB|nr:GntR family transcriptional regulator [Sulfitobacter guttiformis]KIN73302.1 GntR-family transcriptional regulator [Sulfitobacter guttiformis KCTC 32187]RKE95972.1 DNA-binding GntR family transcriptional regulator [Sulfitobacter guttiformis]